MITPRTEYSDRVMGRLYTKTILARGLLLDDGVYCRPWKAKAPTSGCPELRVRPSKSVGTVAGAPVPIAGLPALRWKSYGSFVASTNIGSTPLRLSCTEQPEASMI